MIDRRAGIGITALLMAALMTHVVNAADLKLSAWWPETTIAIDGSEGDWTGREAYVEELKGVIGAANDREYIYIAVGTQNEDLMRQMLLSGFTIWLSGDEKKDREFGVRFPRIHRHWSPGDTTQVGPPDLESLFALADSSHEEPELVGVDGAELGRLAANSDTHSMAAMAHGNERLVFEIRVPIERTAEHPQAVGATLGKKFALGLETGGFQRSGDRPPHHMEGMGGHSWGGSMGRSGGGMGHGGPPGGRDFGNRPKPFELWAKVSLATELVKSASGSAE